MSARDPKTGRWVARPKPGLRYVTVVAVAYFVVALLLALILGLAWGTDLTPLIQEKKMYTVVITSPGLCQRPHLQDAPLGHEDIEVARQWLHRGLDIAAAGSVYPTTEDELDDAHAHANVVGLNDAIVLAGVTFQLARAN